MLHCTAHFHAVICERRFSDRTPEASGRMKRRVSTSKEFLSRSEFVILCISLMVCVGAGILICLSMLLIRNSLETRFRTKGTDIVQKWPLGQSCLFKTLWLFQPAIKVTCGQAVSLHSLFLYVWFDSGHGHFTSLDCQGCQHKICSYRSELLEASKCAQNASMQLCYLLCVTLYLS